MKTEFYIDGKYYKLYINDLKFLGEGVEGKVYKWGDKALKLYKPDRCSYFVSPTIEKIEYTSSLKTKHFIFPLNPVLDKYGNLIGHVNQIIKNPKPINGYLEKPIIEVIKELKEIRKELEFISEKEITLSNCDFFKNYLYNGNIYFHDHDMIQVGFHYLRGNNLGKRVLDMNKYSLNEFYTIQLLLKEFEHKKKLQNRKRLVAKEIIKKFDLQNINFEDLLEDEYKKNEIKNIKQFVKKYKYQILPKK